MPQPAAASSVAIALTIAGSDCSGGAGIQADLKTFSALGVYGATVITALTAQNTLGVQAVQPVAQAFITQQLTSVLSDLAVGAIKTGMLPDADAIDAVVRALDDHPAVPVVVDPVLVATSGDKLAADDVGATLKRDLLPRATLLTPNLPEAAALLATAVATSEAAQLQQGQALCDLGARAVLVKGGHGTGAAARDVLVGIGEPVWFDLPRLATSNTHGTGCTLAAAITALLARRVGVAEAVARAKRYVWEAINAGRSMTIGAGNGPIDHLYAIRSSDPPV